MVSGSFFPKRHNPKPNTDVPWFIMGLHLNKLIIAENTISWKCKQTKNPNHTFYYVIYWKQKQYCNIGKICDWRNKKFKILYIEILDKHTIYLLNCSYMAVMRLHLWRDTEQYLQWCGWHVRQNYKKA